MSSPRSTRPSRFRSRIPREGSLGSPSSAEIQIVEAGEGAFDDSVGLCLSNNRFEIWTQYTTAEETGVGMPVELTPDTGYFWFFEQDNVEVLTKVLNACSFADRIWVFSGGLTDQSVVMTVRDTATETVNLYTHPLGTAFQPINDADAFANCP